MDLICGAPSPPAVKFFQLWSYLEPGECATKEAQKLVMGHFNIDTPNTAAGQMRIINYILILKYLL